MIQVTTATEKLLALRKRVKVVCGGTSASKTFSIILILIDKAQSNKNLKIEVVSESFPHLEGGSIADFKKIMIERNYWKDDRWNGTKHFYTFETGSVMQFTSVDNIGKAHGPRRDILFINEGPYLNWDIVLQLIQRTSGDIWLDYNPTTEFWYYTEIKDKMDHDFITLTYLDNEGIPQSVKEFIESRKGNKNWWAVYGEGKLGEVEGKIYKDWKIVEELPHEARLYRRGMDFGYSVDPTVIEALYEYNGGYIVDEELYQKGLSNKGIADFLLNQQEQCLVVADSAEPKSIDEIASNGVSIMGALKGPGSVAQGIQFVQQQRISVTAKSLKTITAYRNYLWDIDKNGKNLQIPDDSIHEWSNPMDAIRYGFNGVKANTRLFVQQKERFAQNKYNLLSNSSK